jgi:hypothetical protein
MSNEEITAFTAISSLEIFLTPADGHVGRNM